MTVGFPSKRASDAETVLMTSSCEQSEPPLIDVNRIFVSHPMGQSLQGLLSECPISKSSLCRSFEDRVPVDKI